MRNITAGIKKTLGDESTRVHVTSGASKIVNPKILVMAHYLDFKTTIARAPLSHANRIL